jgi:photosystem II stability/assembly factor-like uncharacterized protein
MIRKALRHIAAIGMLLAAPRILGADANTWTGGRPTGAPEGLPALVASDPGNPDVLYGAFGSVLQRSRDGGRTWSHLRSFNGVVAVLVHPASPSTIWVAASDGLFLSANAGETWSAAAGVVYNVIALAGSPTDASTVYAGSFDVIFKTTNAGSNWSAVNYAGVIASLVIDPREPTIAYAGAEGFEYFGDYPGSVAKTTDGGASWQKTSPDAIDSVCVVRVDPVASSNVYIATCPYIFGEGSNKPPDVLRSEDGGVSWTSASEGLPGGTAQSLALDPRVSGTLYAGTAEGVYRSRDGGRSWTPFSQRLAGVPITSLAIDDSGSRLHAGTLNGVYDLEIARGPMDVAAGAAGASRVLVWDGERLAVGTLDASAHWTSTPPGGASATWTAIAIAANGSERSHVLWQNGDGRTSLEIVGPSGREAATLFEKRSGWIATDLSVRADGQTNILWSGVDGRMLIARVDASGATTDGHTYGPSPGWSAIAIADGAGDDTWVLWRSSNGRTALSVHRDGSMVASYQYAAHLDWSAQDVTLAADGRPRLLRTNAGGLASVVTIDGEGRISAGQRFSLPGFTPRRIAAGADGRIRLLFSSGDGQGELLLINPDYTLSARHPLHPLASIFVTSSSELEAALEPANSGKQILVRAGEYEIGRALTVPDRATLVGEGDMRFDASGLPAGFSPSGRTLLRSTPELAGNILTLGDGATVRGLVIEDAAGRQGGNPVVVASRAPGDFVSAALALCEIINPNPSGITPQGPTGRGLVVITHDPNLAADPPPHAGAGVSVSLRDSIIRAPGAGYGVFAINFASHAQVRIALERSVIGGGLNAAGGVSRPNAVTGASVSIRSERNLYRSDSVEPTANGWSLVGGTTASIPNLVPGASTSNLLQVRSQDDRIEGFARGISATGGSRAVAAAEPSSSNRTDLNLAGTRLQSTTADLVLFGAQSFVDGASPGDGNTLRVSLRQAIGSGPLANLYADSRTPSTGDLGTGNQLEVLGDAEDFANTNDGFDPMPPAEFFTSQP